MYLLDTNILIELILNQQKADEVEDLLRSSASDQLFFTEFSLYSLGLILVRRKLYDVLTRILEDLFAVGGIQIVRLSIPDIRGIVQVAKKFNLDFDDAYQYVASEKYDLTLISLDSDFDRTTRGRKTPAQILAAK